MTERRKGSKNKPLELLSGLSQSMEALTSGLRRKHTREKANRASPPVSPSLEQPTQPETDAMETVESFAPVETEVPVSAPFLLEEPLSEPAFESIPIPVAEEEVPTPAAEETTLEVVEPSFEELEPEVELELPVAELELPQLVELPPVPDFTSLAAVLSEERQLPAVVAGDEPAWLADLEEVEAGEQGVEASSLGPVDEEAFEDRLDLDLASTVQEETEELLPAIAACLASLGEGKKGVSSELHRLVHTLKGVAGMGGAMRTRELIHRMETIMEEVKEGRAVDAALHARLEDMFLRVKANMEALFRGEQPVEGGDVVQGAEPAKSAGPKNIRISAESVDRLFTEINEARLAASTLSGGTLTMRKKLREMDDNIGRVSRMSRDLEIQAETQIQSRKAQLAEANEEFDPLEMDRFTRLQELSRLLTEAVSDVLDLHRDLTRMVSEQETNLAYQERSILEVHEGLHKVRLVSVDATLNDRLHKVALSTGKELGKSVGFSLSGGRVALDRALLDKIVSPLEHLIRNAVAHGVESPDVRREKGKTSSGQIRVAVQQEAGRVLFVVEDDGAGLNVERIREKAIEKNMWEAGRPMDEKQAADIICSPGFSTAEAVSQVAGRGVGMDVVRSEVLAMGGRFDLASRAGRGLRASIHVPTTVAAASVMVVEAGGETWSVPIEVVDDMLVLRGEPLVHARQNHALVLGEETIPFARLDLLMGINDPSVVLGESAPILLLREGERRVAVEVAKLRQVAEVPLRSLGKVWLKIPGIVGSTLLPDGRASFLVDPLRAPWGQQAAETALPGADALLHRAPMVLVVDDSITVRKVAAKFLERHGFEPVLAKDGQEALELLAQIQPAAMLLDVEMPRMDGFGCAKSVRENPRHKDLPIIMITSRTADKHRERALSLGVNEYMGKPFREEELLAHLNHYIPRA